VLALTLGNRPQFQSPDLDGFSQLLLVSGKPLPALNGLLQRGNISHDPIPLLPLLGRQAASLSLSSIQNLAGLFYQRRTLTTKLKRIHFLHLSSVLNAKNRP